LVDGTWRPWDDSFDDDADTLGSDLEALDEYIPAPAEDGGDDEGFAIAKADEALDLSSPSYTVTNPPGTVTVTAFLDGRIERVELSAKATDMSEQELAEEIRIIADVARQKARSELHTLLVEGVRVLGYDPATMRDSLIRELDMPTPEMAATTAAKVFASRYSADPD